MEIYVPPIDRTSKDEDLFFTAFFNGNYARGIDLSVHSSDFSHIPSSKRWGLPFWAKKYYGTHKHLMYHAYMTHADRAYQNGNYLTSDYYLWEANKCLK